MTNEIDHPVDLIDFAVDTARPATPGASNYDLRIYLLLRLNVGNKFQNEIAAIQNYNSDGDAKYPLRTANVV